MSEPKKPWEETWKWGGSEGAMSGMLDFDGRSAGKGAECFMDDVHGRIAQCAPEAIRMLLEIGESGEDGCVACYGGWSHPDDGTCVVEHKPDCRWLSLMKKAGVRS